MSYRFQLVSGCACSRLCFERSASTAIYIATNSAVYALVVVNMLCCVLSDQASLGSSHGNAMRCLKLWQGGHG